MRRVPHQFKPARGLGAGMDSTFAFPVFRIQRPLRFFSSRYDCMPTKRVFNFVVIELQTLSQCKGWKVLLESYQLDEDVLRSLVILCWFLQRLTLRVLQHPASRPSDREASGSEVRIAWCCQLLWKWLQWILFIARCLSLLVKVNTEDTGVESTCTGGV
jgi:hypothetical protein